MSTGEIEKTDSSLNGAKYRERNRKAAAALQMRLDHHTWEEVCEVVGYPDPRTASRAVEMALQRELTSGESREAMRKMVQMKLDRLLSSVWKKATDEEHPEQMTALSKAKEILAQQTKLHALDAPTEVIVHSPAQAEIDQWVAEVVRQQTPEVEEADIFDVEWTDGEAEAG